MKLIKAIGSLFILGMFLIPAKSYATHIVGGEMTYRCIANWTFEVTLTIRRDCEYGSNEAQFDNLASVGIFDASGEFLPWLGVGGQLLIPYNADDTLNSILVAECDFLGDPVCVHTSVYTDTITLPYRPGGYILAYQRCCRNETLTNITNPTETGSTYYVRLTNKAAIECNNSPVFNSIPDLYICNEQDLIADMSATDLDGDSLVYKLCTPTTGATLAFPNPQPPKKPLFDEISWVQGFGVGNMLGTAGLSIDSETGIITGFPNLIGQFLVGVCVEEYRDGVLISTVRRDFQYNVRVCIDGPKAAFTLEDEPECDGLEVVFTNTSQFVDTYQWFFDFPNEDPAFVSYEDNPTFTYPADGIYTVKLVATRSTDGCTNEFIKTIGVYDSHLGASFNSDFEVVECLDDSIRIKLVSTSMDTSGVYPIIGTNWTLSSDGFTKSLSGEEITVVVPAVDSLNVLLIVTASNGCTASVSDILETSDNGIIASVNTDYIINSCDTDSINVTLISSATNSSPNATITEQNWTITSDNFIFTGSGDSITGTFPRTDNLNVNLVVVLSNGCSGERNTTIDTEPIPPVEFTDNTLICFGDTIRLLKSDLDTNLTYSWTPLEGLIFEGDDTFDPSFTLNEGQTSAKYELTVSDGTCDKFIGTIELNLNVTEPPSVLDFISTPDCGTTTVCFENISNPLDGNYIFDFGSEGDFVDSIAENVVCFTYPDFGLYEVTLTYKGACEEFSITKNVIAAEDVTINTVDTIKYCAGENVTLNVESESENVFVEWYNEGNELISEEFSFDYAPSGNELITVIGFNAGGCFDTSMVQLIEYKFDFEIDAPNVACKAVDTPISILDNTGANLTYVWTPTSGIVGSNTGSGIIINITQETTFTVTITNEEFGCSEVGTVVVPVSDVSADIVADPDPVYQCNPTEISVVNDDPDFTYVWSTGSTSASFTSDTLLQTTSFSVTVTDENGCTATATKSVTVLLPNCDETDVFLPTAFTPNGDGTNDILKVESNFVKKMELLIYTRWGELVFKSTKLSDGWDGTFDGKELAPDVYAYVLNATCSDGETYKVIGNISLIR